MALKMLGEDVSDVIEYSNEIVGFYNGERIVKLRLRDLIEILK